MSSKDVDLCANNNGVISNKVVTPSKGALLRQKSRNQLNLNFSANSNVNTTNSTLTSGGVGGSVKPNGTITPTSFLQKSFMFQAAKSGLLKRANSVMINYSPAQTPTGVTSNNSTIFGALQRGKLVATPSFSVIDINTNHHHEMVNGIAVKTSNSPPEQQQPPMLQIDSNNSYMNSFRFSTLR